jgi:hypothetical protein
MLQIGDNYNLQKQYIMKKSELKQIIKEEIQKVLRENDFQSFLNSLNIDVNKTPLDRGIDIGSDVTVIKYGQGTITDINDKTKQYTVKTSRGEVTVPFQFVQPIKVVGEDFKLLKQIKQLEKEHKVYYKNFIGGLDSSSEENFSTEKWKLSSIAEFYLNIGQQMWNMIKENYNYITHSDEFEDLFVDILNTLKNLQNKDNGINDDLNRIIQAYEKIGNKINAGVE